MADGGRERRFREYLGALWFHFRIVLALLVVIQLGWVAYYALTWFGHFMPPESQPGMGSVSSEDVLRFLIFTMDVAIIALGGVLMMEDLWEVHSKREEEEGNE